MTTEHIRKTARMAMKDFMCASDACESCTAHTRGVGCYLLMPKESHFLIGCGNRARQSAVSPHVFLAISMLLQDESASWLSENHTKVSPIPSSDGFGGRHLV